MRHREYGGPSQSDGGIIENALILIEADRQQLLECRPRILLGIEGQRRVVLREAVPVGELSVLLLKMSRIWQQDPAKIGR